MDEQITDLFIALRQTLGGGTFADRLGVYPSADVVAQLVRLRDLGWSDADLRQLSDLRSVPGLVRYPAQLAAKKLSKVQGEPIRLRSSTPAARPQPCGHTDPRGCAACPHCRAGAVDEDGRACEQCGAGLQLAKVG